MIFYLSLHYWLALMASIKRIPTCDREVSGWSKGTDISAVDVPLRVKVLARFVLPVEVPHHDVAAPHPHLSIAIQVFLVQQHPATRQGCTHRAQMDVSLSDDCVGSCRLTHSIKLANDDV